MSLHGVTDHNKDPLDFFGGYDAGSPISPFILAKPSGYALDDAKYGLFSKVSCLFWAFGRE
jgi:hypothetical protein